VAGICRPLLAKLEVDDLKLHERELTAEVDVLDQREICGVERKCSTPAAAEGS
jgi:hypothetical protein